MDGKEKKLIQTSKETMNAKREKELEKPDVIVRAHSYVKYKSKELKIELILKQKNENSIIDDNIKLLDTDDGDQFLKRSKLEKYISTMNETR